MSEPHDLTGPERDVLRRALREPLSDPDPVTMGVCLRLCGRRLLQRAGGVAAANGWRGPPQAFMLTRDGWRLLKAERRHPPVRRAG